MKNLLFIEILRFALAKKPTSERIKYLCMGSVFYFSSLERFQMQTIQMTPPPVARRVKIFIRFFN
eukprot:UN16152